MKIAKLVIIEKYLPCLYPYFGMFIEILRRRGDCPWIAPCAHILSFLYHLLRHLLGHLSFKIVLFILKVLLILVKSEL